MKKTSYILTLSLLASIAVPVPGHGVAYAQASQPSIPDDIDQAKYFEIYMQAKSVSDAKRSRANDLQASASGIDNQLARSRNTLSSNENQIAANNSEISRMTNEIPQLRSENQDLRAQIADHQNNISVNSARYNQLNQRGFYLRNSIQSEQASYDRIVNDLNQAQNDLRNNDIATNDAAAKLSDARNRANALEASIAQKAAHGQEVVDALNALKGDLPNQQQALAQARGQLPVLRDAIISTQRVLDGQKATAQAQTQTLSGAQSNLNVAQASLDALKQQRAPLAAQVAALDKQIGDLGNRNDVIIKTRSRLQSEMTMANDRLNALGADSRRLGQLSDSLTTSINQLSAEITDSQLKRQAAAETLARYQGDRKQAEAMPAGPARDAELAKLDRSIATQAKLVADRDAEIQSKTAAKSQQEAQKTKAQSDIATEAAQMQKFQQRTVEINNQINQLDTEQPQVQSQIASLSSQKTQVAAQVAALDPQIAQADARRTSAQGAVNDARKALDATNALIAQTTTQLAGANDGFRAQTELVRNLETVVTELQRKIPQLEAEKAQIEQQIVTMGQELGKLRQETIPQWQNYLSDLQNRRPGLVATIDSIDRDRQREDRVIADLRYQQRSNDQEMYNLSQENSRLTNLVNSKSNTIASNEASIANDTNSIATLQQNNATMSAADVTLRSDILRLVDQSRDAWAIFATADTDAKAAEVVTATKYATYVKVKAHYDELMVAAREKGRKQGEVNGKTDGTNQGTADGKTVGTQDGDALGTQEGLLAGYNKGLKDGEAEGTDAGYKHGFNAPENYQQGKVSGLKQGEADADTFAHQTEYPKARAARKAELLAVLPERHSELDNIKDATQPLVTTTANGLSGGDLFGMNEERNARLSTASNTTTLEASGLMNPSTAAPANARTAIDTFLIKYQVDGSVADCNVGYVDFVKGCQEAYTQEYGRLYEPSYRDARGISYPIAKQAARDKAFDINKMVRWQEGHDKAYPIAYAAADTQGAQDASANGYRDGKAEGYQDHLEAAKTREYSTGLSDESAFFQSSAVIRMQDATIEKIKDGSSNDENIIAGDKLALSLKVSNFGYKSSVRGNVKVKLEALTNNVSTENVTSQLVAIPDRTQAVVTNVGFAKINDTTGGDELVRLRATATYADGVTEQKILELTTHLFIFAQSKIEMALTPDIYNQMGRNFLPGLHFITVTVTNGSKFNAEKDFKLKLSVPQMDGLGLVESEAPLGKLKAGESKQVTLHYRTGSRSLGGKQIPFTFEVFYGEKTSRKDTVIVTPVNNNRG